MTIYEIYKSKSESDTHQRVINRINSYIQKDITALSDGVINSIPKLSAQTRDFIAQPYNITQVDWTMVMKSKEWYNIKKTASILKLGLIFSYVETKNPIFLNFMMVLLYSSLIQKYFPNGYDRLVMKYTLDKADARTDLKDSSLIAVVNKKVDTFRKLYDPKIKIPPSDKLVREILQSLTTRMNETVKALSSKYYKNFNDPDVKVMMEYSKTDDGKNQLNPLSIMEAIREKAVNNLQTTSDTVLKMINLGNNNVSDLLYRNLFIEYIPQCFGLMSKATNDVLDEWIKRNSKNITLSNFRLTFIKSMSKARNISHIMKNVEEVATIMMTKYDTKEERRKVDFLRLRDKLYHYVLLNIYLVSSTLM